MQAELEQQREKLAEAEEAWRVEREQKAKQLEDEQQEKQQLSEAQTSTLERMAKAEEERDAAPIRVKLLELGADLIDTDISGH